MHRCKLNARLALNVHFIIFKPRGLINSAFYCNRSETQFMHDVAEEFAAEKVKRFVVSSFYVKFEI